jgi:Zn-dependent peptidase ImmA (M78 family)
MEVKIAGLKYKIIDKDDSDMNGTIGLANFNSQEIWINKSHTEQTRSLARVHELLHIIDQAYGIDLTEKQVTILAHGITACINDNTYLDLPDFLL